MLDTPLWFILVSLYCSHGKSSQTLVELLLACQEFRGGVLLLKPEPMRSHLLECVDMLLNVRS